MAEKFSSEVNWQPHQQLADRLVELRQTEELPVARRCDDPAFRYLDSTFYFGLIECRQLQGVQITPQVGSGSLTPSIRCEARNTSWWSDVLTGVKIEFSFMSLMVR